MDISIGKLQQLVSVARNGSFSKAALELNVSQPALSRSISAIENHYGFQIFNRSGHGVELTAVGAQVIAYAKPLLESMGVFEDNLGLLGSGEAGTLSIGIAPLLASQLLADFATVFFSFAPKAQLEVVVRAGATLVESLKSNSIETFYFPEGYIEKDANIVVAPVGSIEPVCVVRNEHPLAKRKKISLADIENYPWASSVVPPIIQRSLQPPKFTCDNYHILRDATLKSDLICICSKAFVADHLQQGSLRTITIEGLPLPKTAIYSATIVNRISSPLADLATAQVRKLLSS